MSYDPEYGMKSEPTALEQFEAQRIKEIREELKIKTMDPAEILRQGLTPLIAPSTSPVLGPAQSKPESSPKSEAGRPSARFNDPRGKAEAVESPKSQGRSSPLARLLEHTEEDIVVRVHPSDFKRIGANLKYDDISVMQLDEDGQLVAFCLNDGRTMIAVEYEKDVTTWVRYEYDSD